MPKFLVLITYLTPPDVDGEQIKRQKEVDVLASLTVPQQTALAALVARAKTAIKARYGLEARVDALRYEEV